MTESVYYIITSEGKRRDRRIIASVSYRISSIEYRVSSPVESLSLDATSCTRLLVCIVLSLVLSLYTVTCIVLSLYTDCPYCYTVVTYVTSSGLDGKAEQMRFVKALQRRRRRLFQSMQPRFDRALFRKGKFGRAAVSVVVMVVVVVVVVMVVVMVVVVLECGIGCGQRQLPLSLP